MSNGVFVYAQNFNTTIYHFRIGLKIIVISYYFTRYIIYYSQDILDLNQIKNDNSYASNCINKFQYYDHKK